MVFKYLSNSLFNESSQNGVNLQKRHILICINAQNLWAADSSETRRTGLIYFLDKEVALLHLR
jgi:hypothetical protein